MKTWILLTFISTAAMSLLAGEPRFSYESLGEKVRMSNLIVTGEAQAVHVYDRTKRSVEESKFNTLEDGQVFEVLIQVTDILDHRGRLNTSIIQKEGVRVHFGWRGDSVHEVKKMLLGKRLIYFLSYDYEIPFSPGFFPFHGFPNMTVDLEQSDKVKSLIARISAITGKP